MLPKVSVTKTIKNTCSHWLVCAHHGFPHKFLSNKSSALGDGGYLVNLDLRGQSNAARAEQWLQNLDWGMWWMKYKKSLVRRSPDVGPRTWLFPLYAFLRNWFMKQGLFCLTQAFETRITINGRWEETFFWPNGLSTWSVIEGEKQVIRSNFTQTVVPRISDHKHNGQQVHLASQCQSFPYPQLFLSLGWLLTVGMPNGRTWKDNTHLRIKEMESSHSPII